MFPFTRVLQKNKISAPDFVLSGFPPPCLKSYPDCRGWALRSQRSSRCGGTPGTWCWRCAHSWRWRGKRRWAACTPAGARRSCRSGSSEWSRGRRNATGSTCKSPLCLIPACLQWSNQLKTASLRLLLSRAFQGCCTFLTPWTRLSLVFILNQAYRIFGDPASTFSHLSKNLNSMFYPPVYFLSSTAENLKDYISDTKQRSSYFSWSLQTLSCFNSWEVNVCSFSC